MTNTERKNLALIANSIRQDILTSTHAAKSRHPGGSLSVADYFAYLYNVEMKIDPKNPKWEDRDRFVLSKGHCAPVLYAALAERGFFPVEELLTLRKHGSRLQGHPNMNLTPGVEMSTGSLGQGISTACGMAKGAKFLKKNFRVYTLLGDGELAEGQVWEATMFAAHYKLDNLCIAIDVNGLQIDGATKDVMNTAPLDKRFEAFGCEVIKIDGHDFDALESAFEKFHATQNKPTVILLQTIKGKGVSYMENQVGWHGKAPTDDELKIALAELETARKKIEEAA